MTTSPKIAKATGRSVNEWIGKSPDAKVPDRVRLRILRRFEGKCYLTKILIADGQAFDLEHIKPLEEGGEHREGISRPFCASPTKSRRPPSASARPKPTGSPSAPTA
ncbi:HNH endonuclease [Methylocystis sp. S23]